MTKIFKRPLSIILAVLMVMSVFIAVPMTASANVGDYVAEEDYLTFTAVEDGSSVTLKFASGSNFQYDLNGTGLTGYTAGTTITLANVGDYVRFRGKDTKFGYSNHVTLTGKVACSGNVMSLRLDDNGKSQGLSNYCFESMFEGCTGLTSAPELPETDLKDGCYGYMFFGCTNLTTAPELPATMLAEDCYSAMFNGCASLTTAPELPATTLARYCYTNMFSGCTSLTAAPELPATSLAPYCYGAMFAGCTSLTTAPELPATTLESGCYSRMFYRCSSIKLSETQTAEYSIPYSVPSGGNGTTASSNALDSMFLGTGGTFTGTPEINKIYYRPAKKYTVTDESVNGTVTASVNGSNVTEAAENADVTLTVAPAEGYQFKSITATCAKNGVEDFSDLVALMGDAVADGCDGDFDGYTFKVEDGEFVIYNGSTLFAELSESDVSDFQVGDEIYAESGYGDEGWYFTLSDNKITEFYWQNNTTGDYFFTNDFESTGTLPLAELALTTVTEGSQYSFTMPKKPVTVKAEFEAIPTYTVTWKNGDTVLETDTGVAAGATPTFNGTTPEKAEDANYTYTFAGWSDGTNTYGLSDTLPNVTADVTYTAQFTAVPKPKKLTLNVGENGKVVMDNGTFGNATDASNIVEVQGPIDVADETKVSIVEGHSLNLVEGGSVNIATGGEVSLYPSADNTGVITAIPAEGYVFAGWYNGDTLYSSDAALSYQNISENITLTASFTAHDPHSFVNDPTFNWSQDASTGDWKATKLTLSCECGATIDYTLGLLGVTTTANADGTFTYTATHTVDGVTYTDSKVNNANGVIMTNTQLRLAATAGGEWTLGADVTKVVSSAVADGFVLNGGGHKVTAQTSTNLGSALFKPVDANSSFTLNDVILDGGNKRYHAVSSYTGDSNNSDNHIVLNGVTVQNFKSGDYAGAVYAYGSATIELNDCTVTGNANKTTTTTAANSGKDIWAGAKATIILNDGEYGEVLLHGGTANVTVKGDAEVDTVRFGYTTAGEDSTKMQAVVEEGTVGEFASYTDFVAENIVIDPVNATVPTPDGYKWVDSEESGMKTLVPKEYVAQVNDGDKYESLAEAITAAEDGDTITVLADTDVAYASIANKSITIDAAGYTVTGGQYYGMSVPMFVVKSSGGLTLAGGTFTNAGDSVVNNNGTLVVDGAILNGDAFGIYNGGNLTISSGSVSGNQNSVNNAKANATTTITGGSFTGKLQNTAGEIAVSGGTFDTDVDIYAAPGYVGTQLSATTFGVKVDTNPLNGKADIKGYQIKTEATDQSTGTDGNDINTKGVRILTKVDSAFLATCDDYGYVVAKVSGKNQATADFSRLTADGGNGQKVISCKGSANTIPGYSDNYVTLAVNGMDAGNQVAARFYVVKDGTFYSYYVGSARYNGIIATFE